MGRRPPRQRLVELDKACVWHPFTPMKQYLAGEPTIIEAAEGFELIDTRGRRYIDASGSLWCSVHGHRVPRIDAAIRAQLKKVAHSTLLGLASGPSIELAERLIRVAPAGLKKVFYSDSGAAAVEVALKMAFQHFRNVGQPRRTRFIALREGYHGDTIGSVSVGGIDLFQRTFRPLLFETTFFDSPNPYYHPAGPDAGRAVLRRIDATLAAAGEQYCAVIVEPLVQAAAGMLTHPGGFLRGLREVTRKHGLLLIADEVATGFCRTGRLFACEHEGVTPDLMCLGKGLSGGYLPVSATLTSQEIFDSFCGEADGSGYAGRTFFHGHTFAGNALGCAAAAASFDLIFSNRLMDKLPARIEKVRLRLGELSDHPHVGDIRQCGMMVGIDLVADRERKRPFDPDLRVGSAVCERARRHGILIRPLGDVVVLMPAPGMDSPTLDRLLDGVIAAIHENFRKRPV